MPESSSNPATERRPHENLLAYYILTSAALGPFFFLLLIPRFLRYRTLRYSFDDQGVRTSWGALFRKEVSLDYERIQDIHLSSNLIERWLGLGRVEVQTAAGSSRAEMTIEGLQDYEAVRDALYKKMRGAATDAAVIEDEADETVEALRQATAELRALRQALAPDSGEALAPESREALAPKSREALAPKSNTPEAEG